VADTNQGEFEKAREVARQLSQRAGDQAFMQQLHDNPVQALLDAGMPAIGISDFLLEEGLSADDVSGYLAAMPGQGMNIPLPGRTPGIAGSGGIGRPGTGGLADCTGTCLFTSCAFTSASRPGTSSLNPGRP
jgi:hypothetical protein